ncbi:CpsD/CapB family tyrosine-protein kinase [candidate division KSB1 bacterium]|nr:CpsD/CapB family tyrosine-protein kinase [candidate division KSB1 bacterium]
MSFVHKALKKALEEGKLDPRLLPWEQSNSNCHIFQKVSSNGNGSSLKNAESNSKRNSQKLPTAINSEIDNFRKNGNNKRTSSNHLNNIPSGMLNEIKRIVENILSSAKDKKLQVIGFTSAVPKEGTSTLLSIISLMISEGQSNYNRTLGLKNKFRSTIKEQNDQKKQGTIVIDSQFTNPSLHKIFNVSSELGLYDLLMDEPCWSPDGKLSLNSIVRNISTSSLKLLTVGQKDWKATSQINTEMFKSILGKIKHQFELVFIDIPSLLTHAEGITISKLCDGVVLIIQAEQTGWHDLVDAKQLLEDANVNILGGVLNRKKHHLGDNLSQIVKNSFS